MLAERAGSADEVWRRGAEGAGAKGEKTSKGESESAGGTGTKKARQRRSR
jgi:hypothetical protein